jgi:type II secretory pathway pseudopilin PulG
VPEDCPPFPAKGDSMYLVLQSEGATVRESPLFHYSSSHIPWDRMAESTRNGARSGRCASEAFTLVELLVSMVVLTLLVVCAVGVVNAVSNTVTADRQRLEDDAEARRVFDRMSVDFAKMFKRADADSIFASTIGANAPAWDNDKMFFYADSPTYFDLSTQSSPPPQAAAGLIGYRVLPLPSGNALPSPAPNYWQLERLGKGLTWDGVSSSPAPGGVVFLTYPAASPSPAAAPTPFPASMLAGGSAGGGAFATTVGTVANNYDDGIDADYHVLSSYVFRLEYCFAMKSLSAAVTASPSPSPTPLFEATFLIRKRGCSFPARSPVSRLT